MRRTWRAMACGVLACGVLACGGSSGTPALVEDPSVRMGCLEEPLATGTVVAKRVECDDELVSGPMAFGSTGDILLQNSRVRAIIRGPGQGFYLIGTSGGALIDAAPVGGTDALQELVPLVEFNSPSDTEIVIVGSGQNGVAEVAVRGIAQPLPLFETALSVEATPVLFEQRYRLRPDDNAIEISTRLYPTEMVAEGTFGLIDALFFGGDIALFTPGAEQGTGGRGPFLASHGLQTSYGIVYPRAVRESLGVLELVFFRLLEGPALAVGGDAVTRWFVIGDGSVSSVSDRSWELYGETTGEVVGTTAANVDVEFRNQSGTVTVARSDDAGAFHASLPVGDYSAVVTSDARIEGPEQPFSVAAEQETVVTPMALAPGHLRVVVNGPAGIPARVVAQGEGVSRTGYANAQGVAEMAIPPGTYDITISHGMEYDFFSAESVVVAGDSVTELSATLERVLNTDGWIAVDTHLHSEFSIDSTIPIAERLRAIAGEGIEVAVSSDHDFVVDYSQQITSLGLDGVVASMCGQESTSLNIGHVNAWPMALDVAAAGGGAVPWYGAGPGTVFEELRGGSDSRLIQINHPRDAGLGLFDLIDLDPRLLVAQENPASLGIPGADLNDFGFDIIEVGNAKTADTNVEAFGDWLAFVASGYRVTATGSSDSHGDDVYAGEARTYVYVGVGNDNAATIDLDALNEALRAGHATVSQGAFVVAGIVVGGDTPSLPGQLVDLSLASEVTLRILVQAPPWMPLSDLVIYEKRTEIMRIPLVANDTEIIRYQDDVTLPIDGDTAFVVAVESASAGAPVLDVVGQSFANPLYVDADGDGVFAPMD